MSKLDLVTTTDQKHYHHTATGTSQYFSYYHVLIMIVSWILDESISINVKILLTPEYQVTTTLAMVAAAKVLGIIYQFIEN